MSKKRIFYIIFFGMLIVGFFAALVIVIPGFTKPSLPPISRVQPFSFVNQDGKTITEKDLQGKVVAVNYFFTTCRGVCPRMNNNIKKVYDEFKNEPHFLLLSHTCDPETDSVARLKHYADSMQVNTARWTFVTGPKDSLYNMARFSYSIDDPANNLQSPEDDFLHTQFVALVNKQGEVIRIYDGLKPSELKQMADRIATMLKD